MPRGRRGLEALAGVSTTLAIAAAAAGGGDTSHSAAWRFEPATLDAAYAGRLGPRTDETLLPAEAMPEGAGVAAPARFGDAGSWQCNAMVGAIAGVDSSSGAQLRVEFEHFLVDRFSLVFDLELSGLVQQDAPTAAIVGGGMLLRWHFLAGEDWTVFADAGCGINYASTDVPPGTNRIKFSPQAGVGATLAIDDPVRLIGGIRWYHLSNARVGDTNDGFDAVMGYLGVSIGF